ncbi:hypothetical protein [Sorangium sp. So ce131]|uniref:hypothetical protein n=1 Tax=Sorangium sp. So ce131 TaxID=3133282 RepID=UPI003F63C093
MRRSAVSRLTALVALVVAGACSLDFDQFDSAGYQGPPAGSSGGGGGAPTTSTSAGSGGGEICTNGDDDDGDGAVDCADDGCSGFSCVAVPEDWEGPGLLYAGPAAEEVACPAGFPTRVDVGGRDVEAPATCSPCACGEPEVRCDEPDVTAYLDNECDDATLTVGLPPRVCVPLRNNLPFESYSGAPPGVRSASCPASGGEPTGPAPRFGVQALVCALGSSTGGCGAGETCAPRDVDDPFQPGACVWHEGERRCPEGFGERHVFARDVIDDRGCTRCTCDEDDVRCTATTTFFADDSCDDATVSVRHDESCADDVPAAASVRVEVAATGSCRPRGGSPTGEAVEGGDRITVCCAR